MAARCRHGRNYCANRQGRSARHSAFIWSRQGGDAQKCVFVLPRCYVNLRDYRQVFPLFNLYHFDIRKTDAKRSIPRKVKQCHGMDAFVAIGFWVACPCGRLPKSRIVATNRRLPFHGSAYLEWVWLRLPSVPDSLTTYTCRKGDRVHF